MFSYYDQMQPRRAFVWIHFFEPHEPYEQHEGFSFGGSDIDRYDSEIAYTDAAVGRLIAAVRKRQPNTIIVLAADHGEEFDEHGGRYHGSTLYDEQLRVPLIISIPGLPPHVVDGPVELLDIAPTVLNLLDIPVPVRMRGTDLGPWLGVPAGARRRGCRRRSPRSRTSGWSSPGTDKLLCDLHWGSCAYYDLAADPREQHNLAEARPRARGRAARASSTNGWTGTCSFEPLLAQGRVERRRAGPLPKAIERGRLGDLLAGPELAAIVTLGRAAVAAARGGAAAGGAARAGRRRRRRCRARRATATAWSPTGRRSAPRGWATRRRAPARAGDRSRTPRPIRALRVHAALALAARRRRARRAGAGRRPRSLRRRAALPGIIANLGKLRDRRAVPVLIKHLPEVQNRREMVEALGDIGDPAAAEALLERLRDDEYVPVRIAAAQALAKLGDARVAAALDAAARNEKEATVVAAARAAAASLRARTKEPRSPKPEAREAP